MKDVFNASEQKLHDNGKLDANHFDFRAFQDLDFGTVPTTVGYEAIEISLDYDVMLKDFAQAYISELSRRNPGRLEQTGLNTQDLFAYFKGLLTLRVKQVRGDMKEWRLAKQLYIPSWIQFVMSTIGEYRDIDRGILITPTLGNEDSHYVVDMNMMRDISSKLQVFTRDGIGLHQDAFPRDISGDKDVMSLALIGDIVRGMHVVSKPVSTYVAGFLGLKIIQEAGFKSLYRVRYDDVEFIKWSLIHGDTVL